MKCPECERTGKRSKFYPPTSYFSTAMGGSRRFYDEEGEEHYHEVNSSGGRAYCSEGHVFNVALSTKCKAPGCDYGQPETLALQAPEPPTPEPTYVRLDNLSFSVPREPGGA